MDDRIRLLLALALVGGVVVSGAIRRIKKGGRTGRALVFRASDRHSLHAALNCLTSVCAVAEAPRFFIMDMSRVSAIDDTGLHCLRVIHARCQRRECTLVLSGIRDTVLDRIERDELDADIGRAWIFASLGSAWRAVERWPT